MSRVSQLHQADRLVINRTLEQLADQVDDLTPDVFERLFARYPETRPLFFRDYTGAIKGQMLFQAINCFLDFATTDHFGGNLVRTEMIHHRDDLEVPPDVFRTFFPIVIESFRTALGSGWTPDVDGAWTRTMAAMDDVMLEQA